MPLIPALRKQVDQVLSSRPACSLGQSVIHKQTKNLSQEMNSNNKEKRKTKNFKRVKVILCYSKNIWQALLLST